ncbi:odorant receptor 4-like [Linepithema humile]|uniref:odorant receptor 4-like n=1 Tax=Linepithema humile TaxID=83485 RepID=UPI00351E6509
MINISNQLNLNRKIFLAIGLWPYQKSKFAQFYSICCFSILATFIIFQLTTFVTSKCTIDLVIQILSPTSAFISTLVVYYSFYNNSETVKYLIEQLQRICDNIKDKNEILIIERYANHAKRYTIMLITVAVYGISCVMGVQLWPTFCDIILSAKVTRPQYWLKMEYFIDEERYFYVSLLHTNVALIIASLTTIGTGALIIVYFQYACAMFQIASYRLEQAIQIYTVQGVILLNEKMIYKKIVCAIDIHRKAMMFTDQIISTFQMLLMILLISTVIVLSLNFYCALKAASLGYIKDFFTPSLIGSACLLFLFLCCFVVQQVTDENEHIFVTAYKIRWYLTSVRIQTLILFLLQRGNKPYGLYIGKLFPISLQFFATISNTSVSYCAVMYSVGW